MGEVRGPERRSNAKNGTRERVTGLPAFRVDPFTTWFIFSSTAVCSSWSRPVPYVQPGNSSVAAHDLELAIQTNWPRMRHAGSTHQNATEMPKWDEQNKRLRARALAGFLKFSRRRMFLIRKFIFHTPIASECWSLNADISDRNACRGHPGRFCGLGSRM